MDTLWFRFLVRSGDWRRKVFGLVILHLVNIAGVTFKECSWTDKGEFKRGLFFPFLRSVFPFLIQFTIG